MVTYHCLANDALYTVSLRLRHLVTHTPSPRKRCSLHHLLASTTYGELYTNTSKTVLPTPFPRACDIWWPVHHYLANGALYTVSLRLRHMVTCTPLPRKRCSLHRFPAPTRYGDLYTITSQTVHPTLYSRIHGDPYTVSRIHDIRRISRREIVSVREYLPSLLSVLCPSHYTIHRSY
jgi:hypothetical protein